VTRLALALVVLALTLAVGAVDAGVRPRNDRTPAALSTRQISEMPELQAQVLHAINDLRQERGLSGLRLNSGLSTTALAHSVSMAQHGFFSHEEWNGSSFGQRIKRKYRPLPNSTWAVGENLVWASPSLSADQTIEMWLASSPHRKNLLSPTWREVGVGAVRASAAPGVYGGLDVTIVTADFGVR
jgi:uncharacterized protein YkwD